MIKHFLSLITIIIVSMIFSQGILFAQSSDYEKARTLVQTPETKALPEEEQKAEDKPIGRVVAIEIGGEPSTDLSVIKNQLTFKEGDTITSGDVNLTYKRLYQIGLFWYVKIRYEPVKTEDGESTPVSEEEIITKEEIISQEKTEEPKSGESTESQEVGDIVVYVDVWQAPSWYIYPYESGAIIGDKDFMLSGKTLEAAYFQSGKEFLYYHGRYVDPQFLGSHNVASLQIGHLEDLYGVRNEESFDLSERYALDRESVKFSIQTLYKEDYLVNFGVEWQDNSTEFRNGTIFSDTNTFFLSGEDYTPGTEMIFDFNITRAETKGYPWAKEGYRWSLATDQAFEGLGSDYTFGRYHMRGSLYVPVESIIDTVFLHGEYSTTSGSPPHYQKPRLGYTMRGHSGLDYFGDSTLLLSAELRKNLFDDRFQGVLFLDLGKGFDSRTLSFDNLDTSAGIGIRVDASKFVRVNAILRADYAYGPGGDRWTFGFGQWLY
jgi:outer membrane protein assembly factor BamA